MANDLITQATIMAERFDVDPSLVRAVIHVESDWHPLRTRYEPNWKYLVTPEVFAKSLGITNPTEVVMQSMSWGPMQVMGSVARELGFKDYLQKLSEPELGLYYGCKKLQSFLIKHKSTEDAVASYNAGSPRKNSSGLFENQSYVDKVFSQYNSLKLRGA